MFVNQVNEGGRNVQKTRSRVEDSNQDPRELEWEIEKIHARQGA